MVLLEQVKKTFAALSEGTGKIKPLLVLAALSTGLESEAVRKVKGSLGNSYSIRRN